MRTVQNWLKSSRNYHAGLVIIQPYCTDKKLWQWITAGNTPDRLKKLVELAEQLVSEKPKATVIQVAIPQIRSTTDRSLTQRVTEMPLSDDPILQSIQLEWKAPYTRMKFLQQKLDEYGESNRPEDVAACYSICKEIVELDAEINAVWAKRDYYLEHGKLPDQTAPDEFVVPTDPKELAKVIEATKKGIRRNRLKAKNEPDNPAHVERYLLYKQRYKLLTGDEYSEKN